MSRHPDLSDSHAALGTPVDIKHSGFKSTSDRIPRASTRDELIRIKETKEGVVVVGTSYLQVIEKQIN